MNPQAPHKTAGAPAGIKRKLSAPADQQPESAEPNEPPTLSEEPRRAVTRKLVFQDDQITSASDANTEETEPMDWRAIPGSVNARRIAERRAQQAASQGPENRPFVIHGRNSQGPQSGMLASLALQSSMTQATGQSSVQARTSTTSTTTTITTTTTSTTSTTSTTGTAIGVAPLTTTTSAIAISASAAATTIASPYKAPASGKLLTKTNAQDDPGGYLAEDESGSQEYEDAQDDDSDLHALDPSWEALYRPSRDEARSVPPGPRSGEELISHILDWPPARLIEVESRYIKLAAEQPETLALELLRERGLAFRPFSTLDLRGWRSQDCPFSAAINKGLVANVRKLLELGAVPGPVLRSALPALAPEIRMLFKHFGYLDAQEQKTQTIEWDPTQDELIGIISDRDAEVLMEEESMTIWAAAKQPSTVALQMLMQPERGIAFHPYQPGSNRGWHPKHCPFLCAITHKKPDNLHFLLQNKVSPGKALESALPKMPVWAQDIFRQYGDYML